MEDLITPLKENVMKALEDIKTLEELEALRVKFLGKNGEVTSLLKSISKFSIDDRKIIGAEANKLKGYITQRISELKNELENNSLKNKFDITLPPLEFEEGTYHPITIVQREIEEIFKGMGFVIADTNEVETDFYNFEALNIPKYHPARDMQDTYWLENGMVLRTQTSAGQQHLMEQFSVPIKAIIPGRCFRNEDIDASHENTFFQLEGMVIDEGISVANLIYTMETMLSKIFEKNITVRLRPGYFPFVEPGFELDIKCEICGGKGCPTCKNSGWLELLPCGMIHPNVLKYGGIDSEKYTGFAFGLGLTRLAMMKYGIPDIRVFNSGNLKILKQLKYD
ncbi:MULTISPECIES: phenylalanine--tRNA ligase subunit alpha [unclassified Clostridium]|uniref:phenylalanine--tRNA ligase subunit alpha n=1 Tax=unclassified Clostridium TaxID=2614128 RepID=UPI00029822DB|nr:MULTISPECIES: phenylalanine--tRNA ligase subunit alpha [unclassified Clostridium]EKQ57979.1 MAG: phenylalanyl-tRNA synthetase, alpha subunit [Clostridium sp. Maddingley MBC34-26]